MAVPQVQFVDTTGKPLSIAGIQVTYQIPVNALGFGGGFSGALGGFSSPVLPPMLPGLQSQGFSGMFPSLSPGFGFSGAGTSSLFNPYSGYGNPYASYYSGQQPFVQSPPQPPSLFDQVIQIAQQRLQLNFVQQLLQRFTGGSSGGGLLGGLF